VILLVFLFNFFLDDEFILFDFLPKVKHRVLNILALMNQLIGQRHKGLISISNFLAIRTLSQQFLTFFQVRLWAIPLVHIFL
jgi:hypothetical protein